MVNRRTSERQRQALVDDLRQACRDGRLHPGDMLPTVRELQEKYRLSPRTVTSELRKLVDEGLLRTVPRVGVFVADTASADPDSYLMLVQPRRRSGTMSTVDRVRFGFEERVTQLGAASATMEVDVALRRAEEGTLPPVAGAFLAMPDRGEDLLRIGDASTARVRWASIPMTPQDPTKTVDMVTVDHEDGGRAATQHLWQRGHRRIAFLGLHTPGREDPRYHWSALRMQGWREAMETFGERTDTIGFLTDTPPASYEREVEATRESAHAVVLRRDVTAVVCASHNAALGLLAALRDAGVPPEGWPAMVSFEDISEAGDGILTSVRVPCEDIGREAAQILWERRHGRLTGPAEDRRLPMPVIRRVDSRNGWPETEETAPASPRA
ncbi:GntR family transcriptional regulator [Phytoactinopolyspora halotolerans]|uniref:Substrate-binding domain-containing protein n=1 Tax=Phytoactinopolyspora halotolerans TaxID=1981512 RepID=A0A6L9SHH6_9ACTN|nr:GntR family transcriptional regulator [Phytoactinopolyspora halotolerans]NEE04639.1 substrate-binding domain-containing protein [Phytoactinopolyspora halotolerans]